MKKIISLLTVFISLNASAQDYYHGLGAKISLNSYKFVYELPSEFGQIDLSSNDLLPSIVYKASVGFELNRKMYFAASAYPSIGAFYSSNYNSQSGGSSSAYIGYDLPILGELYFGDIEDNAFHVGLGYELSGFKQDGVGRKTHGPQLSIGGQFLLRDRMYHLRFSYTHGLNKTRDIPSYVNVITDKTFIIGGSLIYMFGM
jgi:hypothetical protein